jgi:hypothetical protein
MKVTLVSPPSEKGKYENEHLVIPKNGIGYIAAYLEKNGIDCSILDDYLWLSECTLSYSIVR